MLSFSVATLVAVFMVIFHILKKRASNFTETFGGLEKVLDATFGYVR